MGKSDEETIFRKLASLGNEELGMAYNWNKHFGIFVFAVCLL